MKKKVTPEGKVIGWLGRIEGAPYITWAEHHQKYTFWFERSALKEFRNGTFRRYEKTFGGLSDSFDEIQRLYKEAEEEADKWEKRIRFGR